MREKIAKGILGGMCIGLGCMGYLTVDNKYVGALLFSIGLLTICGMGFGLFTGVICRSKDPIEILVILCTNAAGISFMALLYGLTGGLDKINQTAAAKLQKSPLELFVAGILCEFCIYIAVIGYGKIQSDIGRNLSIVLPVMLFILCGFEHSIADIFYFCGGISWDRAGAFFLVLLGNAAGAVIMRAIMYMKDYPQSNQ